MSKEITRRDFLKGSATVGAGMLFLRPSGGGIFKAPRWPKDGKVHAQNISVGAEWRYSVCGMCSNGCGIKFAVKKVDGIERVVKIEGNPNHPYNQGKICARGQSGILRTYGPDRIRAPLIRVEGSERGTWKFRKATWEEAFAYIEKKVKEKGIKPYEVAVTGNWIPCVTTMALAWAIGSPNATGAPLTHCIWPEHFGLDTVIGTYKTHTETVDDYENSDYIIALRSNASLAGLSTGRAVSFSKAIAKGARIVVFDPRFSETAAKATKWVPIKPGTDQAFLLALLREVIYGKHYDKEYASSYTNAPFLAFSPKPGMVALAMDKDEKTGKPKAFYVYDEKSGKIVKVPPMTGNNKKDVKKNDIQPALEVPDGLKWNGKPVKTVFQFLAEKVKDFTPEWAATQTDIPVDTIKEVISGFVSAKRPLIAQGWYGARYENTVPTRRTQAIILALMGRIDTDGGFNFAGSYREATVKFWKTVWAGKKPASMPGLMGKIKAKAKMSDDPNNWPHKHPSINKVWTDKQRKEGKKSVAFALFSDAGWYDAVDGKLEYNGEPYRIRMLVNLANNMVRTWPDPDRIKGMLKKLDLVVFSEIVPSDTALYADVILPDYTYLEKTDSSLHAEACLEGAIVNHASVKPAPGLDIMPLVTQEYHIAKIFGGEKKLFMILAMMRGWDPKIMQKELPRIIKGEDTGVVKRDVSIESAAEHTGKSVEEVKKALEEKGVFVMLPGRKGLEEARIPEKYPVFTPSGRLEVYSLVFAGYTKDYGPNPLWDPIIAYVPPKWKEGMKPTDKPSGNEFFFTSGKVPYMSYTATANNPLLMSLASHGDPNAMFGIWIHPDSARRIGVKSGDRIRVTNTLSGGSVETTAYVTEMVRPDTVFMAMAFGAESTLLSVAYGKGAPVNKLWPYRYDGIVGSYRMNEFTVKVEKV